MCPDCRVTVRDTKRLYPIPCRHRASAALDSDLGCSPEGLFGIPTIVTSAGRRPADQAGELGYAGKHSSTLAC